MKTTMMRVLAIAILTTSMSAFALSGNSKTASEPNTRNTNSDEPTVIYVIEEQPSADQNEAPPDQMQKDSEKQQKIERQDKQWLHDLQGVYGG